MKQMIKNEDLKNVSGGKFGINVDKCSKCESTNFVYTEDGCSYIITCKDCGNTWKQ